MDVRSGAPPVDAGGHVARGRGDRRDPRDFRRRPRPRRRAGDRRRHPRPQARDSRGVTSAAAGKSTRRRIIERVLALTATGVCLYLLAPSLLDTLSSWPELRGIDPLWLGFAVGFEAMSSLSYWALQR